MDFSKYLPSTDYQVRKQIDEIFSREMLGAVIVGKFVGDYAAFLFTSTLGTHVGLIVGVLVSLSLFIYWHKVERRVQQAKESISQQQTQVDDWVDK